MYKVRRATVDDIPVLLGFRGKMFISMGKSVDFNEIRGVCEKYFKNNMKCDSIAAWVVETKLGEAVACISTSFYELPPKPENPTGKYMYVFNLYTEPEHRRKGLGSKLLTEALDYAREVGVRNVILHASEMGKRLFRSIGFKESNEMSIVLN